ncbi:MAG: prolipoprotein diacylglyceryl transferase [Chloroflexi bacterium]|nr:prolipoprotein diacylglyceryl transferase [Chloroflexota bacterium]
MPNGIVININPAIFHFGGFELRWYSLTIILAIIAAVMIGVKRGRHRGFAADDMYSLAMWVILSGMIGARLFHVVDRFDYYLSHPAQILALQQGGLAIWGALGGGALAAVIFARVKRWSFIKLGDVLVPGILVAQMIGRIGCIINGDAYGDITSLPWGFIYTHPGAMIPASLFGVPTHPYPVYEMLWNGLTLLGILYLGRRVKTDGVLFLSYVSAYSLGRFLLTFVRLERDTAFGLQQAQVIALFLFVLAVSSIIYVYFIKRPARKTGDSLSLEAK